MFFSNSKWFPFLEIHNVIKSDVIGAKFKDTRSWTAADVVFLFLPEVLVVKSWLKEVTTCVFKTLRYVLFVIFCYNRYPLNLVVFLSSAFCVSETQEVS